MFTAEQIDVMSREMVAKAESYYDEEVFAKMAQSAKDLIKKEPSSQLKLRKHITNAFLEGVAEAMSYMAAALQRQAEMRRKEDLT